MLLKQGYTTTKKRDKYLFNVDDLVNVLVSLWTEDDPIFIYEGMRLQISFLLLSYCFTGARVGAFLHNGKAEVKRKDGRVDKLVFKGLTWKVRRNTATVVLNAHSETDNEPGRSCLSFPSSRWNYGSCSQDCAMLGQEQQGPGTLCVYPSSPHLRSIPD